MKNENSLARSTDDRSRLRATLFIVKVLIVFFRSARLLDASLKDNQIWTSSLAMVLAIHLWSQIHEFCCVLMKIMIDNAEREISTLF